jgi:hypothetical protein
MNIFSILKIDDEFSVKQYPLGGLRLDPWAVSPGWSISNSYRRVNILSMYT